MRSETLLIAGESALVWGNKNGCPAGQPRKRIGAALKKCRRIFSITIFYGPATIAALYLSARINDVWRVFGAPAR
jgi:hypothetical protein